MFAGCSSYIICSRCGCEVRAAKKFSTFLLRVLFFLSHYRRILVYRKTWEVFEFIHHLPPLLRPHHLPLHHLRLLRGLLLPHPRPHPRLLPGPLLPLHPLPPPRRRSLPRRPCRWSCRSSPSFASWLPQPHPRLPFWFP